MIPQDTVDRIIDSAHIEEVVSDFVTLKRRGANFVACCPFHNEKTPSFYVSPSKGIYKCFGCGKSGNALGFVMEHEHCSYVEALQMLARKYHIEIVEEQQDAEEIARRQRRESLLLVSEFAQKFFASQLSTPDGRAVGYAYLRSRGMEDATISKFGLGWAPSGRTAFVDAALAQGYKMEYILGAGLAVQREDGSIVDKFRERVMFPVHSLSGRVVAFSGRTLRSDNPAKYVNSPETEIYVKSRNLLGIYFAKSEIARLQRCILVEGNVDMVTLHQLGITNVVASCGTSLTVEQIRLIKRFTENVTIMYDGDSAGIHAALRGIDLVLAEGLNVKIVLLPDGEDPDSFGRRHSLAEVQDFIAGNEKDFIVFKAGLLLSEAGNDPLKKANLINDIADTVALIPDAVKRSTYVESVSSMFGVESGIIFDRIRKERGKSLEEKKPEPVTEAAAQPLWAVDNRTLWLAEQDLVRFLLTNGCDVLDFESDSEYYSGNEDDKPTVADFIRGSLESSSFTLVNTALGSVYDAYFELYDEGLSQEEIMSRLYSGENRAVADMSATLAAQKYQLTVEKFEASLTTTSFWLVTFVPKAILVYAERRLQDRLDMLRRSLQDAGEERTAGILQEIVKVQASQRRIKQKIGREKSK